MQFKKIYCFFDSTVLTFGQNFLFPSSNTVFETICPQWKAFRASEVYANQIRTNLCENRDSSTWKKFRKNPGRRQPHRKMSDIFPSSRLAGVGQAGKQHREF